VETPPIYNFFHFTYEMYFHLEIMASSSNHGSILMGNSFSFSSCDDEILEQFFMHMDRQRQCVFACAIVVFNLFHMFNANDLEEGASWLMDPSVEVKMCSILCKQF
jgi:hypothetical protein